MKKMITIGLSSMIAASLLTSCAIEMTHDSTSIKQIKEAKLADGSTVRVGYTPVVAAWKCRQLYKKTGTLLSNKVKGSFTLGGAYQQLEDDAIAYANQAHLKTNYIFLYSPHETGVNGLNLSIFSESSATFYQCKQPPAVKNSLFS